jgi:hypothetical protein
VIRLNRSKFGNWPSGPRSRLSHPSLFMPGFMGGGGGASRYKIDYSLRLRAANSAYLSRTGSASPTSTTTFTYSVWVKLGAAVAASVDFGELLSGYAASSDTGFCALEYNTASGAGTLRFSGWSTVWRVTTAVYRDPTAWYHVVLAVDTTQGTAANRIKIYINGAEVTSFSTSNNPGASANVGINNASAALRIGSDNPASSSRLYDGLIANPTFVDGQALTPSSFGQTDAASGQWVPKKYTGTYGANGFLLEFKDASAATAAAIGKDTSGNGHNWTPSGISVTAGVTFDQSLDTPTNSHAKFSPLYSTNAPTYQNANERITSASAAIDGSFVPFDLTTGLYYAEVTNTTAAAGIKVGVGSTPQDPSQVYNVAGEADTGETNVNGFGYNAFNGNIRRNASTLATLASWNSNGDRIGIATRSDGTNLRIWLRKNGGSWLGTGSPNPATDTDPTVTITLNGPAYLFGSAANGGVLDLNTGQRAFVDTPPTGFLALNTQNMLSVPVTTSGTFTGNAAADGPLIYTNGNPATLTINGNAVTFGTHADKTAGGFKLRTSSASYNASGSNTWTATAGGRFVNTNKVPNNAQVNP